MYNTAPNTNTILHLGKGAPAISILKPNKNHNIGTSYQSIPLLSTIVKAPEKSLLPKITENIPIISYQNPNYGYIWTQI